MSIITWAVKHASTLLTITSSIGVVVTAVLSSKAVPEFEQTKKEWEEEKHEPLTTFEKVQAGVKAYLPTAITAALTIFSIYESRHINKKTIAALTGAAAIVTKKYDDYRTTNINVNGKEAHDRVMDEITVQKAKNANISAPCLTTYCTTGEEWDDSEERLFYDSITEQFFTSTLSRVLAAEYYMNRDFTLGADVNVQMWCDYLGIENKKNDKRGWTLNDGFTWLDFDNREPTYIDGGLEACIIDCYWEPVLDYEDYDGEWPAKPEVSSIELAQL